jgi:hypothetical protein
MYTVNDVNQLCFWSRMITLWGADISPGTDFPAAEAGRFGFAFRKDGTHRL